MIFRKYLYQLVIIGGVIMFISHPTKEIIINTENNVTAISPPDINSCSWNGIELKGKVKFVESFPDIKIQVVESFPDIKVKLVGSFPDDCGEWQVVESFPDFTVQVVESFPDIKVQYVESFPGIP